MKRKFITVFALLAAAILCFAFAACGNNKDDKTIKNLSGDCGFTAEGEFAEGSTLVVEPLRGATEEQKAMITAKDICVDYNMRAYDISVEKGNAKVQPNGKVKITLDFNGDSPNGYTVFHFKSDAEMEVLAATLANGKLSFETTSFSVFIIGENKPEEYDYTITYDLDGGSFADGVVVTTSYSNDSEFPLTLPTPQKSGYTFKGWKNVYDVVMTEITADTRGDVTLTAQWEKAPEPAYIMSEDGKTVTFGSYPQTLVKDETLKAQLNKCAVSAPTLNDNGSEWISFGFYSKGVVRNYAWYKDIELDGVRYRGVYFNEYRMSKTSLESTVSYWDALAGSQMYDSGVRIETVYWFKFEPLKWRVLTKTDGKAFLMCDNAIFATQFQHNMESAVPCDYEKSDIRKWLNDSFYGLAFGSAQKDIILDTEVDNSVESAKPKDAEHASWNTGDYGTASATTIDKVFLLSVYDVTNPDYGFKANPITYDSSSNRVVDWTDYGIYVGGHKNSKIKASEWLLRSPMYRSTGASNQVKNSELVICEESGRTCCALRLTDYTSTGIVPALWINL